MMNDCCFTKEEILINTYNMSKEMCKSYLDELTTTNDEYLYDEYLDLLDEQLDITREVREMIARSRYKDRLDIEDDYIEKTVTNMVKKLESISK